MDISFGLHVLYIKSDFEKAYDIVEKYFVLAMLKALRFGHYFICSVESILVDASTGLSINHGKFKAIGLFHFVRYDFPLTLTLYVLVIETLGYLFSYKANIRKLVMMIHF